MTTNRTEGIHCPKCHGTVSSVIDARKHRGGIKRIRICDCGKRLVTMEKVEKEKR